VLFVDDEEDMRILVSSVLEEQGYRVLTAEDTPSALKLAFAEFPDLVITDVMMPGESGFTLCEKLKADPSTKNIPVVFLSVMDEEVIGLQLGAAAFLGKPFDVDQMKETVEGILGATDSRQLLEAALEDLREKRVDDAVIGLEKVIESDPRGAPAQWARYYMGQLSQQKGEIDKAKEHYRGILEESPGFWRAHNRLGLLFQEENDAEKAFQHFERSLALNPNQPDVEERLKKLESTYRPTDL